MPFSSTQLCSIPVSFVTILFSGHEAKGAYSPRELAPGNTALNFFSMESLESRFFSLDIWPLLTQPLVTKKFKGQVTRFRSNMAIDHWPTNYSNILLQTFGASLLTIS